MSDRSPERKASSSSKKAKDTGSGQTSTTLHGISPPSSGSRSLPSTPQPWPPSGSPQSVATSRHSPVSYHDWPEYYDLSAELSADSRRQIQPHSAPSYLGAELLGQSQSYGRYQTYGHNVVNGPHYPVSVADAYGSSSGSGGSGVSQTVGYQMPMENTSQVMSGANQGSSYPNQYLQGQGYYDEPSGATTSQGQLYLGWTDLNDVNYAAIQGQSYRRNA
ncbi:hypothetical protein FOMPIDRAFT_115083 [Fomitopsis schrenkii]|uniref:Uncharacterized protein n=1 Tax=Fomitopsis schrenkii TaxID=2126942 RepID=S8FBD7_FOMSC|nr:hypothetical protein FOMPIDRAFT_115083 [Fomitopsis schrenkii]